MIQQSNNNSIPLSSPSSDAMYELRKEYEKLPLFKRILSWFRFVNRRARLYQHSFQEIKMQIESRNSDWKLEWNTPEDAQIVENIGQLACELLHWPAARFIPDDRFWMIFLMDFDDMVDVEFAIECEREFGVNLDDFLRSNNRETTLNDLVNIIKQTQAMKSDSQ